MPITLVQITDTHIHDQAGADFKGTQPDRYLSRILRHIKNTFADIDCLILSGDITHDGTADACHHLKNLLKDLDCPIYVTPGNHDNRQTIARHLVGDNISMPERVDLGGWQLLFADSHMEGETSGRIDSKTIRSIELTLSNHQQPALIFTHHPPLRINSQWLDEIGMQNGEEFIQRMVNYEHLRAILFGHIHQQWESREQHLMLLGAPSTCVQFKPLSEEFGIDEIDPGYRVIQLHEHHFDTRVLRCPMLIKKILSGGQTGVDRAALDCAIELAVPHGGWCPRGRLALDGPLDSRYLLKETPSSSYPQRTEWNVRDADATLILGWGPLEGGSALTAKLAERRKKPCFIIDLNQPAPIEDVWHWLINHDISVLNIAGPRQSKAKHTYSLAKQYISRILRSVT